MKKITILEDLTHYGPIKLNGSTLEHFGHPIIKVDAFIKRDKHIILEHNADITAFIPQHVHGYKIHYLENGVLKGMFLPTTINHHLNNVTKIDYGSKTYKEK